MLCADHLREPATWRCLSCDRLHCEACVKRIPTQMSELEVCKACGGVVTRVQVLMAPPEEEARSTLALLKTPEALVTAAALAVPGWLGEIPIPVLSHAFLGVYFASVSAWVLQVVDHVGRGLPGLPSPGELGTSLLGAIGRGAVVALVVLAPWILWGAFIGDGSFPGAAGAFLTLLLGLAYAPAALVSVTLHGTTLAAWWVPTWRDVVVTNPEEYRKLTGAFVIASAVWIGATWALHQVLGLVPIVGPFVAVAASTLGLTSLPLLVGVYLRRHAEDLGLVRPGQAALIVPQKPPPGALR